MQTLVRTNLEMINIRTWHGVTQAPVWRYKDFAVHEYPDKPGCEIIHVPSGFGLPATFQSVESATKAMADVQALREDWAILNIASIGPKMAREIASCVARHGGIWHPVKTPAVNAIAAKVFGSDMNGYTGPSKQ